MKVRPQERGFTLMEIMIVIMIMALVLTIGIPSLFHGRDKESMRKSVADVVEICSHARAQAILAGSVKELVIRPVDGTFSIGGTPEAKEGDDNPANGVKIPEGIRLEMVDVNFVEFKDQEEARVRFYPNGTSDEFTLVLESDKQEFRKITLDVVTGLAEVEVIR